MRAALDSETRFACYAFCRLLLPCAVQAIAPPEHTATAATSTLCKLLTWDSQGLWQAAAAAGQTPLLVHQADYLSGLLHGQQGVTDWWVVVGARSSGLLCCLLHRCLRTAGPACTNAGASVQQAAPGLAPTPTSLQEQLLEAGL